MTHPSNPSISTTSPRTFYYNEQLRRYIIQFMAIFGGMRVRVGKTGDLEPRLITVPIAYGSKDRVVAAIKADNTQNKQLRLPIMSAYISELDLAPESRKGVGAERRQTYLGTGALFPDDTQVVHQLMPIPYKLTMELSIYASNTDQHLQILEQILILFDPVLQIQTNDDVFDWTKISTVELTSIRLDENYPAGTDRRIIQSGLLFSFVVYLSAPANVKKDYVRDIFLRIGTVSTIVANSEDMLAELDAQGFGYDLVFSVDDISLV